MCVKSSACVSIPMLLFRHLYAVKPLTGADGNGPESICWFLLSLPRGLVTVLACSRHSLVATALLQQVYLCCSKHGDCNLTTARSLGQLPPVRKRGVTVCVCVCVTVFGQSECFFLSKTLSIIAESSQSTNSFDCFS